jgi:SAM-dependent methyltransferase
MQTDYAATYARLYREHWWWRARETIVVDVLRRVLPPCDGPRQILDVGCGDAVSFPALVEFGEVRGIEMDEGMLDPDGPYRARIATRPLSDPIYDADAGRYDLVTALDVIEHIEDDRAAVAHMAVMLRPGGLLVVTVPALMTLWDHHDVINHHYRRYTRGGLREAIAAGGLELLDSRYLFHAIFGPKLAVKLLNRGRARKVEQHHVPPPTINRAMRAVCVLEHRTLGRLRVPFGTSVLAVARKPVVRA